MNRWLTALGLACVLLGSIGCSSEPENPPPKMTIPQLDIAHVTAVEVRMKQDPDLINDQIKVSAQGDMVVLDGTVGTDDEKERAEALAKKVEGVKRVANHLAVVPRQ